MSFVNLGTRNKGTFWEYNAAYSFLHAELPDTAFDLPTYFGFGQGIANQHCHDQSVIDAYANRLFWKEFDAGMYSEDFFTRYRAAYADDLARTERLLAGKDLAVVSNEELAALFETAFGYTASATKPMLQALLSMYLEERFQKELLKVLTKEERNDAGLVQQVKAKLLTAPRASIADREESAIIAIEDLYWNGRGADSEEAIPAFWDTAAAKEALRALTEEFGWFRMEYMHEPFMEEDFKAEIGKRLATRVDRGIGPLAARELLKREQEEFFRMHPGHERFQDLVRVIQEFAFVLDHTKDVLVHEHFHMRPLFVEMARRLGTSHQDLLYLVPPEMTELLVSGKKADQALIDERKRARAVRLKDGEITWYAGEEAVRLAKELLPEEVESGARPTEIKGIVAYPGIYTGKAVVVKSIQDRDKFSKGDVFVVHDGSAEFNLFLQQAGAIVTNEGGMICHAAIVAREMKTPAIVGTRIATKVIRDGDMLEVDATKGIVRILSV